jgi:hypothetical protein
MKAQPKLSNPEKMPCYTWSLQAFDTCPGALTSVKLTNDNYSGKLKDWFDFRKSKDFKKENQVDVCRGCYAQFGNYRFKSVIASREHNEEDWQKPDWVSVMVSLLKHETYFRWFDSGDIYCVELANKILQVCQKTPHVKHWIPTRSYKIKSIAKVLNKLQALDNVVVRISGDLINREIQFFLGNTSSVITEKYKPTVGKGYLVCQSKKREGKCGNCRACWNKEVNHVYYPTHGLVMKSVAKKLQIEV